MKGSTFLLLELFFYTVARKYMYINPTVFEIYPGSFLCKMNLTENILNK